MKLPLCTLILCIGCSSPVYVNETLVFPFGDAGSNAEDGGQAPGLPVPGDVDGGTIDEVADAYCYVKVHCEGGTCTPCPDGATEPPEAAAVDAMLYADTAQPPQSACCLTGICPCQ